MFGIGNVASAVAQQKAQMAAQMIRHAQVQELMARNGIVEVRRSQGGQIMWVKNAATCIPAVKKR